MCRWVVWFLLSTLCAGQAPAQLVGRKNLVTTVGIGGAWGELRSPMDAFNVPGPYGGNFSFSFSYSFNPNWGLGIRYDRLGMAESVDTMAQARIALLHVHGSYRPWQSDREALEIETGFGSSSFAFRGLNERLPLEANSWSVNGSVRYLRHVHRSMLVSLALRGHTTGRAALSKMGSAAQMNEDTTATVQWRAILLSVGLAVKW